jgi:lipopolysaccharide export system protein LptA
MLELLPGSDVMAGNEKTGITRLIGNVHFTYDGNVMFCDSAHYKIKTEEVWAYGKVQINKRDSLNLFCDSLYYQGKIRKAKLWGHVRIRDREYKLTTDSLEYDAKRTQAIYRRGGRIENIETNEVLTSRVGYFNPNTEDSFFRGNVVYKSDKLKMTTDTLQYNYLKHKVFFFGETNIAKKEDPGTPDTKIFCKQGWYDVRTDVGVLMGDAQIDQSPRVIQGVSLYYNPKEEIAIGRGNITVLDTTQKVEFNGNYFYSNEALNQDLLTDKPWVRFMKSKDTLYLGADTLYHFRDTTGKTLRISALNNVKIFQNKIQGRADSLLYDKANGMMDLWGNPKFWAYNSELSGDSIRAYIKNDTLIDKIHLRYNAFAANEVDSGQYYNQLAGKEIWAYFRENELVQSRVIGNARTVSFPTDTIKTDTSTVVERKGMNRVYSADIRVDLDSGEVSSITFLKQPEGKFYPMDQIEKQEQFLQGFSWNPALRPKTWQEVAGIESEPPKPVDPPEEEPSPEDLPKSEPEKKE